MREEEDSVLEKRRGEEKKRRREDYDAPNTKKKTDSHFAAIEQTVENKEGRTKNEISAFLFLSLSFPFLLLLRPVQIQESEQKKRNSLVVNKNGLLLATRAGVWNALSKMGI